MNKLVEFRPIEFEKTFETSEFIVYNRELELWVEEAKKFKDSTDQKPKFPLPPRPKFEGKRYFNTKIQGICLALMQDHAEYDDGPGLYPCFVIETEDGKIHNIPTEECLFLDKEDPNA